MPHGPTHNGMLCRDSTKHLQEYWNVNLPVIKSIHAPSTSTDDYPAEIFHDRVLIANNHSPLPSHFFEKVIIRNIQEAAATKKYFLIASSLSDPDIEILGRGSDLVTHRINLGFLPAEERATFQQTQLLDINYNFMRQSGNALALWNLNADLGAVSVYQKEFAEEFKYFTWLCNPLTLKGKTNDELRALEEYFKDPERLFHEGLKLPTGKDPRLQYDMSVTYAIGI